MRRQNPFYDELVAEVHLLVSSGRKLTDAVDAALADPPTPLYPRLTPAPMTLRGWFLNEHPHYRRVDIAAEVRRRYLSGQSQAALAEHYGVTTRAIRNWLALAERSRARKAA